MILSYSEADPLRQMAREMIPEEVQEFTVTLSQMVQRYRIVISGKCRIRFPELPGDLTVLHAYKKDQGMVRCRWSQKTRVSGSTRLMIIHFRVWPDGAIKIDPDLSIMEHGLVDQVD